MQLSIAKKLSAGFGTQVVIIIVLAVVVLTQVNTVNRKKHQVLNQNVPSVKHAIAMQGEIHHALSMHRGYMILGLQALADERVATWDKIAEHITVLEGLSSSWENPETVNAFAELKEVMGQFRSAQDEIAAIAHTDNDVPAKTMFFDEAMPHGRKMMDSLDAILVKERSEEATADRKLLVEYVSAAKGHMLLAAKAITAYLVSGDEYSLECVGEEVAACQASVDRLMTKTHLFTPAQKKDFDNYISERELFLAKAKEVVKLRSSKDWCQSEHICLNSVTPLATKADQLLSTIVTNETEAEAISKAELTGAGEQLKWITLIAATIATLIGVSIAVFLSRQITGTLNNLLVRIKDIAQGEGDLTQRVEVNSGDEIGQLGTWFNTFVTRIHDVIAQVSNNANEVAAAATEIAASSEEIARGMNEQSMQINQVSSAVEEMSASVVEVARKSADASDSAKQSGQIAVEGGDVVDQTIAGMRSINDAVSSSADSVQELGKRGEQIGEVIAVINDIADQTNLLALNAAIEAARAGEHGRGFAVVADEVRQLADRTTQATNEIAGSIQAIQSETSTAVQKMNAGTEQVTQGVEGAEQAGSALKQIVQSAQDVSQMVEGIAASAKEQSTASDEVSRSIEQIAMVTRQTSEGTSQAATAAGQLSGRAETLQQLVSQFKTNKVA